MNVKQSASTRNHSLQVYPNAVDSVPLLPTFLGPPGYVSRYPPTSPGRRGGPLGTDCLTQRQLNSPNSLVISRVAPVAPVMANLPSFQVLKWMHSVLCSPTTGAAIEITHGIVIAASTRVAEVSRPVKVAGFSYLSWVRVKSERATMTLALPPASI